jgi:hypothetical protein
VNPDGRVPRVKSDIKAKRAHGGKQSFQKPKPGFRHSQKVLVTPSNLAFNATPATPTITTLVTPMQKEPKEDSITTFRPSFNLGKIVNKNNDQEMQTGNQNVRQNVQQKSTIRPSSIFSILNSIGKPRHTAVTSKPAFNILNIGRRSRQKNNIRIEQGK